MFYKYEIKNNGVEDVLYLYMTMKYEFASEFSLDDKVVNASMQKFIKTNNIKFRGNKVCIVMDGSIVKCLSVDSEELKRESYLVDSFMITISLDDNSLCEISLREYLLGVLLSKYMESLHIEALKAMTVLYTTFAFKMMHENNCILSTNRFAIFKPFDYFKADFNNYDMIINKLNEVINEVDGVYLTYNDDYILPFMHYSNSGRTLTNKNYPYLSSVKSLWDLASPYYIEVNDYSYEELSKRLNITVDNSSYINIINDGYRKVKLGDAVFSIQEIKSILNLKSEDIYIIVNNNSLRIITKGWGKAYGLSIFGACEIARDGLKYSNILKYYFPKTKLLKKVN